MTRKRLVAGLVLATCWLAACEIESCGGTRSPPSLFGDAVSGAVPQTSDDAEERDNGTDRSVQGESPRAVETALRLDGATRQLIQHGLRNEGFDPGPIDGRFGPRTRAAIRRWQGARAMWRNGFLNGGQAAALQVLGVGPSATNCEEWNTEKFFLVATAAVVTTCLREGADVAALTDGGLTPLHIAAGMNTRPSVIDTLLEARANIEARGDEGLTPLYIASLMNPNPAVVEFLLGAGARPDPLDRRGRTPLELAVAREKWDIVELLLDAGADSDAVPNDVLDRAVGWFSPEASAIEALVETGADVNVRGLSGFTPLHRTRDVEIVQLLLEAGANVMEVSDNGSTPLHTASVPEVIEALLAAGADVSAEDVGGGTPLHRVSSGEEVEALVAAGASVDARDGRRQTPLHRTSDPDAIAALVAAGASVDARDGRRQTPLHRTSDPDAIAALVAAGADVDAQDERRQTPLHQASDPGAISALVAAGANVSARDRRGQTPVHRASEPDAVAALVEAGANVNARDLWGRTPLHLVAYQGVSADEPWRSDDIARLQGRVTALVTAGANLDARDEDRNTPLHLAARWQNPDPTEVPHAGHAVDVLLDAGAHPSQRNDAGETPRDLAEENRALRGSRAYWLLNEAHFNALEQE